jgi:HD-GYP domain-containing protein (c-di-GMP phosphodiesterase class II)/heme/copper-type cytochrome/quinol oxidase subunit 2
MTSPADDGPTREPTGTQDTKHAIEKEDAAIRRRVNKVVLVIAAVLVAVIAAAIYFSFSFVNEERRRDLQGWQIRLGIIADSRTAAVNEWVEQNFTVMRELAENQSLQIYVTELTMSEGDKGAVTDQKAQAGYLRNLLVATAERAGFAPPPPSGEVAANIERAGVAGIGIVDSSGKPIVSSPGMPPLTPNVQQAILEALKGKPAIIDVFLGATNLPTMGFVLPIFGIQDIEGGKGIGAVVGIRTIGKDLYDRLKQPGETSTTSEAYLVRQKNETVEYLSPLADGTPALKRSLAADTPDLAATFAIQKPGGFAIKRNYLGKEVLTSSRKIAQAPWVLVKTIARSEALAETETRLNTMFTVFVLIIVGVTIAIIAVWRHGSSVRATQAAEKYRVSSERFENISKFMRLVTNSQPTKIVAVDGTTKYTFANAPAAAEAGIDPADMIGKTMAGVMGPVKANVFAKINNRIISDFAVADRDESIADPVGQCREEHIHHFGESEADLEVIKSYHIPLRGDRDHPPGVLMVIDDITALTREQRRSESVLHQLIDTLVNLVDRRDPYSAHQSKHVSDVASAIAKEMNLSETDIQTVEFAGKLTNLGKILVPASVMNKGEAMTADERRLVFDNLKIGIDLIQDVDFQGPVVETIRQMHEAWNGSGPLGLMGMDILETARILAVASAFVGMVKPRIYREAMTFDIATDTLLAQAGTRFDRRPVSALINFLENRGGKEKWAHFRDTPQEAAE